MLSWAASASGQEVQRIQRAEGADAWSLRLEEVLAIGSMEEGDASFGRIMDVAWDGRNRILVADDLGPHVKVFESDGTYVRTIGREGDGPGEFSLPWQIAVDAGDSLYVWDAAQSRISVFSPDHDFIRSILVSPAWVVTSIEVPAPDRIVVAAFAPGETLPVKVLDKEGAVLRQAGRAIEPADLAGHDGSLLGGSLARVEGGYAYTNKSPWAVTWFDRDLRIVRTCVGPSEWTTPPGDAVQRTDRGVGLAWNRYVHSASIVGLPGGVVLNTILDPAARGRAQPGLPRSGSVPRRHGQPLGPTSASDPPVAPRRQTLTRAPSLHHTSRLYLLSPSPPQETASSGSRRDTFPQAEG